MSDAADRLAKARVGKGYLNPRQAAEANGWPYQTYYTHETGRRDISVEAARRYADAYNVDPAWLLLGDLRFAPAAPDVDATVLSEAIERSEVPVVGTIAPGEWNAHEATTLATAVYNGVLPYGTVAYRVTGDCMDTIIPEGSLVFVAPGDLKSARNGQIVVVLREAPDGTREYTLKVLLRLDNGGIVLIPKSNNAAHLPIIVGDQKDGIVIRLAGIVAAWQSPARY